MVFPWIINEMPQNKLLINARNAGNKFVKQISFGDGINARERTEKS